MNRQLIYGLLLCILLVSLPHATHLPQWVSALCATLLAWRAYLCRRDAALPGRALLAAITLGAVCAILIEFHTLFGREAGVAMLVLLTALKPLEYRGRRDAMALIYLCCFISITGFFYSQSPATALYMFATLLAISTIWVHLYAPRSAFWPRLEIASTLLLQAIPLTLMLFLLFPRVQGPLWGMPQDAYATSGLDDSMSPGSFGRLSLSDAVAFRASFDGAVPRRDQMYWRGPVLWRFDGRRWTPGVARQAIPPQFTGTGQAVDYTVTLEAHNKKWLFALDMPDTLSVPYGLSADFQALSAAPVNARLRYRARSDLAYRANPDETQSQLQRALQLPKNLNPKAVLLAQSFRPGTDLQVANRALAYFNHEKFYYTLNPKPLGGNGIDDFLFTTREGYCEHYASAFVFLMRAAGIPARVVTGYQGGEYNALGGYYIVRQSDAHAWAEIWIEKQGWRRIDPTAAVAPDRVEKGLAAALPDSVPFIARNAPGWMKNLGMNWDALSYRWNQWVIGYDTERQIATLSRIGLDALNWQRQGLYLAIGVGLTIALYMLLMLRPRLCREPDRVQAAWLKLCKRLARKGLARAPHEGPQDYARRVESARPDLPFDIADLASRYSALRYGRLRGAAAEREFLRLAARAGRNAIMRH